MLVFDFKFLGENRIDAFQFTFKITFPSTILVFFVLLLSNFRKLFPPV